jgi:hypothetical protein
VRVQGCACKVLAGRARSLGIAARAAPRHGKLLKLKV